jgi:hypothetical protein
LTFAAEDVLAGTLPIPLDVTANVLQADGQTAGENDVGMVSYEQCEMVSSPDYPDRFRAFGGSGIKYEVGLEQDMAMVGGEDLHVNFEAEDEMPVFTGEANVLAGDYMYVLSAMSEGVETQYRKWNFTVRKRPVPETSGDDARADSSLHGNDTDDALAENTIGLAGDWNDFVPADFTAVHAANGVATATPPTIGVSDTGGATVMNVPRLQLSSDANVELTGALGSNDDVDVFWLGELAPNWKLELTVAGRSVVEGPTTGRHNDVTAELYEYNSATKDGDTLVDWDDGEGAYRHQIGVGTDEGLTCGQYYIKVSGEDGNYELAWNLTEADTPEDA